MFGGILSICHRPINGAGALARNLVVSVVYVIASFRWTGEARVPREVHSRLARRAEQVLLTKQSGWTTKDAGLIPFDGFSLCLFFLFAIRDVNARTASNGIKTVF